MNKRRKLIRQIFPSYLLITLLSLFAVSWYASSSLQHFYLDQTAIDLHARARLLEELVIGYLSPLDAVSVDSVCKAMGKGTETRFTIILPAGKVVGDSIETPEQMDNHANRPEIKQALSGERGRSIRYSDTLRQKMMYVAVPIVNGEKGGGVVRASLPITFIENELNSIRIKIIIGGVIVAIVAAGVSLAISRRISRPLETLKKGAVRFAEGDLGHRLAIPDSAEMASLAEAMNQMAAHLEDRIKTVSDQRNEFETVLTSMLEGVIAVDNEERIVSMNQAAAKWFEIDPATYQNRNIQEIIRNIALQQFITASLASDVPLQRDFTLYNHNERILNVRSSPLADANQEQIGTLVVFNDVTQIRRLENMRRDFVANVSHELKTPLTAIKGFVETLQHGNVEKPEETERFLDIIQKHADRLNAIIEDLMMLSRIEQEDKEKPISFPESKFSDVLQAAAQICRPKAEEKKIHIDVIDVLGIVARFDPHLLEQAVVNLIDNAIKYSDSESTIQVVADHIGSEMVIRVQDQGIGIAKKHHNRLFERFYRVDKARSRNQGGTGLGLAIVKHIAQAHGGRVTVESRIGAGSTFTIHLPIDLGTSAQSE
jgi:two-component system phosphate regulon sensor histidine kinase PhoR